MKILSDFNFKIKSRMKTPNCDWPWRGVMIAELERASSPMVRTTDERFLVEVAVGFSWTRGGPGCLGRGSKRDRNREGNLVTTGAEVY